MIRIGLIIVLTLLLVVSVVGPVSAHALPPCNDSGEPGHSDYAKHHVAALAKLGMLGAGGHVPGSHQGYSLCLGVH